MNRLQKKPTNQCNKEDYQPKGIIFITQEDSEIPPSPYLIIQFDQISVFIQYVMSVNPPIQKQEKKE